MTHTCATNFQLLILYSHCGLAAIGLCITDLYYIFSPHFLHISTSSCALYALCKTSCLFQLEQYATNLYHTFLTHFCHFLPSVWLLQVSIYTNKFWLLSIYVMYMVVHISAGLGFYMYTVLYIVIYALCTHISCTNLAPSCSSNIPLPSGQEILVATAAFLLCGSCMGKFRILYTKPYS